MAVKTPSLRPVLQPRWISAVAVLVTLFVWYLVTMRLALVPSLFFPSPADVWGTLTRVRETILVHAGVTLLRVLASFVLGSAVGIVVGLLMSRYGVLFGLLDPFIEALRPVPPIALIPFFILWFGLGDLGKLVLAGLGCFMVLVIGTVEAVRNVPRIYLQAARSLGASESHAYRTVVLRAITPELIGSLRVALALAFGLTIAAELMGAQSGIGYLMMVARRSLNTDTILLGIIILGIEAWLADRVLQRLTGRVTTWTGRAE
ncbi:MAG: ABC transporter permease [Chloroflexota bacterium]|nr:ABC transporter permease [Chloroflexota bacterium]